ncbi:MAG: toll/interleukin-1 receptor domain-containing protein [Myxococcota bacterium]
MSRRKALEDFLRSAFSIQELERWIEHLDSELRDAVDWRDSKAQVVFHVVERLAGRGRLDARFFRALAHSRSARADEVQLLAGLYAPLAQSKKRSAANKPSPEDLRKEGDEIDWYVFVSYAPTEREDIYPLAVGLHERGVRVFLDEWMVAPGQVASRVIEEGLVRTMHGLIAVSPRTAMEDWARAQYDALLDLAVTRDRLLIPVLLGEGPLDMPPFLRLRRPVDLRNKGPEDLDADVDLIVRALKGRPPGPPPRTDL